MTLQEFISVWQAQPFRAFRMHARKGVINVRYPMAVALTPQMQLAAIRDDGGVEIIALEEIDQCEIHGEPRALLGQQMRWADAGELRTIDFPEADRALIELLASRA